MNLFDMEVSQTSYEQATRLWRWLWIIGLACVNIPLIIAYLGPLATLVYLACFLLLAAISWLRPSHFVVQKWPVLVAIVLSLTTQLLVLQFVSPQFEMRIDRSAALTYWLSAALHGDYPYAVRTNLGNAISVLPSMPLLALPFTLLGNVGLLMVFSYLAIALLLWHFYQNHHVIRFIAIVVLSSAPLLFFEVIGRSDILANTALFVGFLFLLVYREEYNRAWTNRTSIVIGLLLGALAATRIPFWPLLVAPVIYLWQSTERRSWLLTMLVAILVFMGLTAPFAIWDPQIFFGFAPISVNSRKLGTSFVSHLFWPALTMFLVFAAGFYARRARDLYVLVLPAITVIVMATGLTFFFDLAYLQMIFVPLLFASEIPCLRVRPMDRV